jgi:transcriptional regulator with XRE-family HTH domain
MTRAQFKAARERLGLTQAELADILGKAMSTISRYETGDIPIPKLAELAMAYLETKPCKGKKK